MLASCASARRPAWPPRPGEPAAHIIVYGARYHSVLALPRRPRGAEEWAFGERIWFYDEKDKDKLKQKEYAHFVADAFRALFWPNRGVIEVSMADKAYDLRNPESKVTAWEIPVSEEGLARLRAWLDGTIGTRQALLDDGWQSYYSAARRYHVLHTCHHYVAHALREAGVPVHPGACLWPTGLWMQLNGLARRGEVQVVTHRPAEPSRTAQLAAPVK